MLVSIIIVKLIIN